METSKYKGVHFSKAKNRWIAAITKDKQKTYLGQFINELDAHHAYQKAIKGEVIIKETRSFYRLTKDQIQEVITSDLGTIALSKKLSITPQHICAIRRKNGVVRVKTVKPKAESKTRKLRKVTPEILSVICDPYLSADEAHVKTGIGKNHIWKIRKENNIRHITTTILKKQNPKKDIDKVKLQASMTADEQNYLLRQSAKQSSKGNHLTEAEKIAAGTHRWTIRIDKYGKKSSVLERINKTEN